VLKVDGINDQVSAEDVENGLEIQEFQAENDAQDGGNGLQGHELQADDHAEDGDKK
jgi:hypothetical protein